MKKKCFCRPFLFFLFTSFVLGGCGQSKNNGMEEPGGLGYHAMAYDSESDKIVLYGGYLSTATWIYDLNTDSWRKIEGGLSPENRMFPAMTYDETVDRVILFGGGTGAQAPHFGTVYSDTWSFDCNTGVWEKLTPPRNPGKRVYGALVFCGKRGISVLFGGWSYDVNYPADGALWGFDYHHQDWFTLDREESLTPLRKHAMVYDPMRDEAVIFGGISGVPQPASEPPFLKDLHLVKM